VPFHGARVGRQLAAERAAGGEDAGEQVAIAHRLGAQEAAAEHGDRVPARIERALVRGRIDAERAARHHGAARAPERRAERPRQPQRAHVDAPRADHRDQGPRAGPTQGAAHREHLGRIGQRAQIGIVGVAPPHEPPAALRERLLERARPSGEIRRRARQLRARRLAQAEQPRELRTIAERRREPPRRGRQRIDRAGRHAPHHPQPRAQQPLSFGIHAPLPAGRAEGGA